VVVGLLIAVIVNLGSVGWLALYRLEHSGVHADARVTAYDRGNHNSCSYAYEVAGQRYSNTESCDNYDGGSTVAIVYDKHDPTISIAGDPTTRLDSQLITWLVAIAGFTFLITAGFRRLYRWLFSGGSA
jgi:hypothetical protein